MSLSPGRSWVVAISKILGMGNNKILHRFNWYKLCAKEIVCVCVYPSLLAICIALLNYWFVSLSHFHFQCSCFDDFKDFFIFAV